MRFVCPEVDKESTVRDLCKLLNKKTDSVENYMYPMLYAYTEKNGDYYYYGSNEVKKYLNVIRIDNEPRSLSEWTAFIGLDIQTNFDAATAAREFVISASEILKMKSEAWITIFTDQGIRLYRPQRIGTSKQITSFKVIERYRQNDLDAGYFGDSSGSVFGEVIYGDTINIQKIDTAIKNMIVNTYIACADIVKYSSSTDANPLDFINDNGAVYLNVSKKEDGGLYYYTAVRESVLVKSFVTGPIDNPNCPPWHYIGNPGEPAWNGADVNMDESTYGKTGFRKVGNRVFVEGAVDVTDGTYWTFPTGFRPLHDVVLYGNGTSGTWGEIAVIIVHPDGTITNYTSKPAIYFNCSFPTDKD